MSAQATAAGKTATKVRLISLKTVIFGLMLTASLVPLGLSSYMTYQETSAQVLDSVDSNLVRTNQANARSVDLWIGGMQTTLRGVAQNEGLIAMNPEAAKAHVDAANKALPMFANFTVTPPTGFQVARSGGGKLISIADRDYFKVPMTGSEHSEGLISRNTGKPNLFLGTPIRNAGGEIVGVLAGLVEMKDITDKITGGKIGQSGYSYLIGKDGKYLAHPDLKKVDTAVPSKLLAEYKGVKPGTVVNTTDDKGKPLDVVIAKVGDITLVSQIDHAEKIAPIKRQQQLALGFLAIAVVLIGLMSWFFARAISRKLQTLAALAIRVSTARNENEIMAFERQIAQVGGVKEVRVLTAAFLRLTSSIKLAMRVI